MMRLRDVLRVCAIVTVLAMGATIHAATIETVLIGNPGNAPLVRGEYSVGSVSYSYRLGKYEVTWDQYVEFLNGTDPSGTDSLQTYNPFMTSYEFGGVDFDPLGDDGEKYNIRPGRDKYPVLHVTYYSAIRFANWLHNGQGQGNTESGAYTLAGGTPTPTNPVVRNPGAQWFLPSLDEWFKAAHHKNDGVTGNYWEYPTRSDVAPQFGPPPGNSDQGSANYRQRSVDPNGIVGPYEVGSYIAKPSDSPYGTFDQGGNVEEYTEQGDNVGGMFVDSQTLFLQAGRNMRHTGRPQPLTDRFWLGFRVASVPEPAAIAMAGVMFAAMLAERKWKGKGDG